MGLGTSPPLLVEIEDLATECGLCPCTVLLGRPPEFLGEHRERQRSQKRQQDVPAVVLGQGNRPGPADLQYLVIGATGPSGTGDSSRGAVLRRALVPRSRSPRTLRCSRQTRSCPPTSSATRCPPVPSDPARSSAQGHVVGGRATTGAVAPRTAAPRAAVGRAQSATPTSGPASRATRGNMKRKGYTPTASGV